MFCACRCLGVHNNGQQTVVLREGGIEFQFRLAPWQVTGKQFVRVGIHAEIGSGIPAGEDGYDDCGASDKRGPPAAGMNSGNEQSPEQSLVLPNCRVTRLLCSLARMFRQRCYGAGTGA